MIDDIEKAVRDTSDWILHQANKACVESLVLGVSGGVDSAVVAGLAASTGMPVYGVIMPCHSSPDSISRAEEVIAKFGIRKYLVNLELAWDSISEQIDPNHQNKMSHGALRSCLRAPTLDYVSKIHSGIIVGTGNRDEDEVTRYYQKRGDGCVDISPIAKYHKSEIYQLAHALEVPESVIRARPSADLWGPDSGQEDEKELQMTYAEIEWGMQFAARYSSIPLAVTGGNVTAVQIKDAFLQSKSHGAVLTARQKIVLERLLAMENTSRHKANPSLPVFQARTELNLDSAVAV